MFIDCFWGGGGKSVRLMINYLVINLEEGCRKPSSMFCIIWKNEAICRPTNLRLSFVCV